MTEPAVLLDGVRKSYRAVEALRGLDLAAAPGTILGLLGPNGAGKTTAVRILATLLEPDAGHARVAGHDCVREPDVVRSLIGLTGQYAAVDENLTGRENLELVGRLLHLGRTTARARADELLLAFGLAEAGGRTARTYSGGMRRRLDLAASLVGHPAVLFLDEPTTGLDPRSRLALWEVIERLRAEGTTILLTTQYLEEADRLADRIAVIDLGRVIAEGTADELKTRLGGDVIDLRLDPAADFGAAVERVRPLAAGTVRADADARRIHLPVRNGSEVLPEVVRVVDADGPVIIELALHRPSLDDVFLALTGRTAETDAGHAPAGVEAAGAGGEPDRQGGRAAA
ncbi:MAG: ATP-binding cassette domain-containing protein [Chloroflexi bacterium]|jgi:ABC-2 type transport system ATP-binding protein|nr:ATP-binding cassette domain-containing protein [Chloroflexota bacterium]